jgi:hypothetical protein
VSSAPSLRSRESWWNPQFREISNVEPGTYEVELNTFGQLRVESARCGAVDLLSENLTVPSGSQPSPIEITLRNDGATVMGTVIQQQGDIATVLLVQQHGDRNLVKALTRVPGTFRFDGLAPGDYFLLASEGIENWEYTSPQVLNPYLSTATHIRLQPHGAANVKLNLSRVNR